MDGIITSIKGLNATNNRINSLRADFSGLKDLDIIVSKTLNRLLLHDNVRQQVGMVNRGSISIQTFDGWFSQLVRAELGKTLGVVRAKAMRRAAASGAGSATGGVLRRTIRDRYAVNLNIGQNNRRLSHRTRQVAEPTGGKSGIRRQRTVSDRTAQIRGYYGPDRSFILRILENGRDVFYAHSEGPTGARSQATYGQRGAMPARNWFFHQAQSDMELAAAQLGYTLKGQVETWIEQKFNE